MRYEIAHQLRLTYPAPIWEHHVEVRLTPRADAHQTVLASSLALDPPCEPHSYDDCFGNRVHYCSLIKPHDHLTVSMRATVETMLQNPFEFTAVAPARELEWVAEHLRAEPRLWAFVLHHSPRTPDLGRLELSELAFPAHDPGQPVLDAVLSALEWMGEAIAYEPEFRAMPAKLEDVLAARAGGCQDLAHLLISIARAWGFPARYVMGYQDPAYADDDEPTRPHAWAEILIPGAGWRGVDPTTRLVANHTYVAVAVGRDAADAAPIKAVCKGGEDGSESEVAVEVTRDQ